MMITIVNWQETYEPDKSEGGTNKPLRYVKWQVHGHDQGAGFRRLAQKAGPETMACLGLFGKLVELAGDEQRQFRDGTIRASRGGEPMSVEDLSFEVYAEPAAVRRWLSLLSHPRVKWVIWQETETSGGDAKPQAAGVSGNLPESSGDLRKNPEQPGEVQASAAESVNHAASGTNGKTAGDCRKPPDFSGNRRKAPEKTRHVTDTDTETETETQTETKTETETHAHPQRAPDVPGSAGGGNGSRGAPARPGPARHTPGSGSGSDVSLMAVSDSGSGSARVLDRRPRLARATVGKVQAALGTLNRPPEQSDPDKITIHRACVHALSRTCDERLELVGEQVVALARDKVAAGMKNPTAAWVAAMKLRFGVWPEYGGEEFRSPADRL